MLVTTACLATRQVEPVKRQNSLKISNSRDRMQFSADAVAWSAAAEATACMMQ